MPRGNNPRAGALVRSLNKRTAELTKIPLSVIEDGSIQAILLRAEFSIENMEERGVYPPFFGLGTQQ